MLNYKPLLSFFLVLLFSFQGFSAGDELFTGISTTSKLTITVKNVGQGNGIILKDIKGKFLVIDAGSSKYPSTTTIKDLADSFSTSLNISQTEEMTISDNIVLVVSHPDKDHINILPEVFKGSVPQRAIEKAYLGGNLLDYYGKNTSSFLNTFFSIKAKLVSLSHKIDISQCRDIKSLQESLTNHQSLSKKALELIHDLKSSKIDKAKKEKEFQKKINEVEIKIEELKSRIAGKQKTRKVTPDQSELEKQLVEKQTLENQLDSLKKDVEKKEQSLKSALQEVSKTTHLLPFSMHVGISEYALQDGSLKTEFLCLNAGNDGKEVIFSSDNPGTLAELSTSLDSKLLPLKADKNPNISSAIVRITVGHDNHYIFPGDATEKTTARILNNLHKRTDLKTKFLVSSHHGADSHGSNNLAWAFATSPEVVAFSASKHLGYRHPRFTALSNYYLSGSLKSLEEHNIVFAADLGKSSVEILNESPQTSRFFGSSKLEIINESEQKEPKPIENSGEELEEEDNEGDDDLISDCEWLQVKTKHSLYSTYSSGDIIVRVKDDGSINFPIHTSH